MIGLTIARLSHPHIVQLIGLCYNEKYVYLVTEYITGNLTMLIKFKKILTNIIGGDLRAHIKNSNGKLTWDLKIQIALDIAKAMAFLHSKDIIHRDLKSKNLLVDVGWRIKGLISSHLLFPNNINITISVRLRICEENNQRTSRDDNMWHG